MEIVLKQGDRIRIPEGCKATIDGNEVVIEKKEQEFKDGDILASTECAIVKTILIFKGKEPRKNSFRSHFNSSGLNEEGWSYPFSAMPPMRKSKSFSTRWKRKACNGTPRRSELRKLGVGRKMEKNITL